MNTRREYAASELAADLEQTIADISLEQVFGIWASGPGMEDQLKYKKTIQGFPFQKKWVPHTKGETIETTDGDKYALVRILGRGGMGEVWEAVRKMKKGERRFAIKFINYDNTAYTDQLLKEGQLSMDLDHPNIVDCEGNFERAGNVNECFIVMNYVDQGRDFRKLQTQLRQVRGDTSIDITHLLDRRAVQIPAEMVQHVGVLLAEALKHAHKKGAIHRDVKPANIIVDSEGRVRLMDFGIAVPLTDSEGRKSISGTPIYMSPETFDQNKEVDERTDIWSAGIALYELATGGLTPFDAALDEVAAVTVKEPIHQAAYMYLQFERMRRGEIRIAAPHEVVKNVPLHLSTLIMQCLHVGRENRIQTAEELSDALSDDLYASGKGPMPTSWESLLHIYDVLGKKNRTPAEVTEAFGKKNRKKLEFLIDDYQPVDAKTVKNWWRDHVTDKIKQYIKKYLYDDPGLENIRAEFAETNFSQEYKGLPDGSRLRSRIVQWQELTEDAKQRLACGQHPCIVALEQAEYAITTDGSPHISYTPSATAGRTA